MLIELKTTMGTDVVIRKVEGKVSAGGYDKIKIIPVSWRIVVKYSLSRS